MLFFFICRIFFRQIVETRSVYLKPRLLPSSRLSLVCCLHFSRVCRCLHTTDCGKLVKQTKGSAGVGWGPDIVLALGWGTTSQGPLYESCSP